MTQFEAIEKALEVGCAVTGLSADAMLFSPAFDGYLDMVCQRYDVVQDEPATRIELLELDPASDWNMQVEQLRRGG